MINNINILKILINVNQFQCTTIVHFCILKNIELQFLIDKKRISNQKKKYVYNTIIVNKMMLTSKNGRLDKKIK